MNVLFIGKWDIAGAYIADRLIREGNEACWMTDEEEKILWNKRFKGNIYRGVWRREDYMRILKANSVDTVVFLTAKFRENYEETGEHESQMLELTNVLNVLRNYPLRCLVYLSSVELDYDEIHTPVLTDLAAGEMLCEAYHNAYELPVLILRMGCVYGSFGLEEMGYTGTVLNRMRRGERIESLYHPDDYIDAIYGEDVAIAVHRLLKLNRRGTYRLMTGYPLTMEEYYRCLGEAAGCRGDIIWHQIKHTAPPEYFKSDDRVKLDTGWMPFYLLPEKGKARLEKALGNAGKMEERMERKRVMLLYLERVFKNEKLRSIAETLLMFCGVSFLLNLSKDVSDLKYVDIRLMFVAVVSCLYGAGMGLLAIALACGSYAWGLASSQVDISYLLYSVDTWIPFVVYAVTGAWIGYVSDRKKDEKETLEESYSILEDKYEFIQAIYGQTLEIKGNLQRQIITSRQSFGHAYEVAVELDSLKPELILLKVIGILEHIMDCDKAAVFLVNSKSPKYARLKACSRGLRDQVTNSVDMDQFPEIYKTFEESRIFVNTDLLPEYPDYAAPIYFQGMIYGFVAIYDIGTEKFTVYFQNLFRIITSLIEKNLVKALEHENIQRETLYFPGTELLYPRAFEDRLSVMGTEGGDIAYTYVVGKVYPVEPVSQKEAAERIASVIRGSDCMGIDKDGDYAVILVNMSMDYLEPVKERFDRRGLKLEVEQS